MQPRKQRPRIGGGDHESPVAQDKHGAAPLCIERGLEEARADEWHGHAGGEVKSRQRRARASFPSWKSKHQKRTREIRPARH